MKQLSTIEDFAKVKELKGNGSSYADIAKILTHEGYVTISGKHLCPSSVSKFMVSKDFRLKKQHTRAAEKQESFAPLAMIVEVTASNMSQMTKFKIIQLLTAQGGAP